MKQIPLTRNCFAIIDDDMFDELSKFKWHCDSRGYAVRSQHIGMINGKQKRKNIWMHNQIMNAPANMEVDHKNPSNKLDNRRRNLRVCTHTQNLMNRRSVIGSSSKYKGVSWSKRNNKWLADIRVRGRTIYLGYFVREEDAALAYNFAAVEHQGEFARLNRRNRMSNLHG